MIKYVNEVKDAPQAIGPYSQATVAGNMIFISGQIPIDPATGKLVDGGIEEQTERVLQNLQNILKHLNLSFGNVMKATIFLIDLSHFQKVNAIYSRWLEDSKPARATIQVRNGRNYGLIKYQGAGGGYSASSPRRFSPRRIPSC
jgi:2-iminobutanoate/2-iminopropanoate deaminase